MTSAAWPATLVAIPAAVFAVARWRPEVALPLLVVLLPVRLPVGDVAEVPTLALFGAFAASLPAVGRAACRRPAAAAALLAMPAWVLLSGLWARQPWFAARESLDWLALALAALLAMALSSDRGDAADPKPLVAAVLAALLPSALWGVAEHLHLVAPLGDPRELALRLIVVDGEVRSRALFYHPNRLGEFVEQAGLFATACAVLGPLRAWSAAGALLAVAGAWSTGSAASIAVMAGFGLVAAAVLLAWRSGIAARWARDPIARRRLLAAAVGVAAAVVVAALIARRAYLAHGGLGPRGQVYAIAVRIIRSAPLLGVGGGNWGFEVGASGVNRFWYTHAHSLMLQLWAELGLVGVVLGALAFAVPLWHGLVGTLTGNPRWRGVAAGASLGVIALLLHDVVHFFLRSPADGLLTGVLLGIAAASLPPNGKALATRGRGGATP